MNPAKGPKAVRRPDVEAAFLGMARRHLDHARREGDEHREGPQHPDGQGARARRARGGDPLQVRAGGDEEQDDVPKTEGAFQPRGLRRGVGCRRQAP